MKDPTSAAPVPQATDPRTTGPGETVHSPGDLTWFEFRSTLPAVIEAMSAIHAHGDGKPPEIGSRRIRIAPDWAREHQGFVALTADLEPVALADGPGVRVHLSVHGNATPSTAEAVEEAIHGAAERALGLLAQRIGDPVNSGGPSLTES